MNDLKDIFAVASLLIKFECDHILEDQALFIEFINELGFRTPNGNRFEQWSFRALTQKISAPAKSLLIEEFNVGHESLNRQMMMYSK